MKEYPDRKSLNNNGFTLIEVIVCMAILAVAFLPMLNYFTNSLRYTEKSRTNQTATLAAQKELEELKAFKSLESIQSAYRLEKDGGESGYLAEKQVDGAGKTISYTWQRPVVMDGDTYYVNTTAVPVTQYSNARIETMDGSRDVVAVENELMEFNAVLSFMSMHLEACDGTDEVAITSEAYFRERIVREIHMDFIIQASSDEVLVKTYYRYYLNTSITGVIGLDNEEADSADFVDEVLDEAVRRTSELKDESIWLFYNAKPGNVEGDRLREDIIVNVMDSDGNSTVLLNSLADSLYLVCQNRQEIEDDHAGGYELHIKDQLRTDFDIENIGKLVNGLYTNIPQADVQPGISRPIVTEETDYSRMADITIAVYKKDPTAEAGQEPLVTLTGVYEGGIQ